VKRQHRLIDIKKLNFLKVEIKEKYKKEVGANQLTKLSTEIRISEPAKILINN